MIANTTPLFVPFHQIPVASAKEVRMSVFMEASSGDLQVVGALRGADVEEDLPSATVHPNSSLKLQADGVVYGTGYSPQHGEAQIAQFGVQVSNIAASKRQQALVTVVLEIRE